jgi:hypothetical protein
MTDIEKLARDICWADFHTPPQGGKVKYWAKVAPGARASYIQTAKEFVWLANRLGKDRVASVYHRVSETSSQGNDNGDRAQFECSTQGHS